MLDIDGNEEQDDCNGNLDDGVSESSFVVVMVSLLVMMFVMMVFVMMLVFIMLVRMSAALANFFVYIMMVMMFVCHILFRFFLLTLQR